MSSNSFARLVPLNAVYILFFSDRGYITLSPMGTCILLTYALSSVVIIAVDINIDDFDVFV